MHFGHALLWCIMVMQCDGTMQRMDHNMFVFATMVARVLALAVHLILKLMHAFSRNSHSFVHAYHHGMHGVCTLRVQLSH